MGLLRLESITPVYDSAESPLAGSYCYIYAADSDRLAALYEDTDLTVLKANPLIADEDGVFDTCHLFDGTYRVVVRDSKGNPLLEEDVFEVRSVFSMSGGSSMKP